MKKIFSFIISTVLTMCIIGGVTFLIIKAHSPKLEYSVSSYMSVENDKGIITDTQIDFVDCLNKDGDLELKIGVGSHEERQIKYEISFLVNYEQASFRISQEQEKLEKIELNIEQNMQEYNYVIDKSVFNKYNNDFLIIVRQDVGIKSCDNELVRDTNTIVRRYNLVNESMKDKNKKVETINIENEIGLLDEDADSEGVTCEIGCVNRNENVLIEVKKNEHISLNLNIGRSKVSENYVVWAYIDSEQLQIDNKKHLNLMVHKNRIGNQIIEIIAPNKEGIYELEVFCAPAPYEMIDNNNYLEYEVGSAQRYTIKVEE